jgi:hypothetical protein
MLWEERQKGPEDGGEDKQLLDGPMNVLELERGSTGDVEDLFGRDCGPVERQTIK